MKALVLYLVALLGHDDFRVRDSAEAALTLATEASDAACEVLPLTHPDPEVNYRLRSLAGSRRMMLYGPLCGRWNYAGGAEGMSGSYSVLYRNGEFDYHYDPSHPGSCVCRGRWWKQGEYVHMAYGWHEVYAPQKDGSYKLVSYPRDLRLVRGK